MLRHLELFAGIGGFRKAIELLGEDYLIRNRCVGYSEIDKYAVNTYKSNFNTDSELEIGDVSLFTADNKNVRAIEDFDLLTGGFPCQSFSMMGKMRGFEDKRGDIFYKIIDILKTKKPPFVLLENVKNLKTHDKGMTLKIVINALRDAGYSHVFYDVFNSANFKLAQRRNRIFIFASRVKLPAKFEFSQSAVMDSFRQIDQHSSILKQINILDVLEKKVDEKYYLSEKVKPTILSNGTKGFISNSEINQLIARPLTATMVKLHRACQDNYFSDDFISSENPLEYNTNGFSKRILATHKIRKITPKEAFLLQGFDEQFLTNAINKGISNFQLYKQAGNAVSVNSVYAILHYLFVEKEILRKK
jgi:DNA (cytosine-5)-methyltransferase 1